MQQTILHSAGSGGNYFHIHVGTPIEYCEATDRKGVYARARNGEIKNIPGVDVLYETPETPDLLVDVTTQTVPEIVHSEWKFCSALDGSDLFFSRHCFAIRDQLPCVDYAIAMYP